MNGNFSTNKDIHKTSIQGMSTVASGIFYIDQAGLTLRKHLPLHHIPRRPVIYILKTARYREKEKIHTSICNSSRLAINIQRTASSDAIFQKQKATLSAQLLKSAPSFQLWPTRNWAPGAQAPGMDGEFSLYRPDTEQTLGLLFFKEKLIGTIRVVTHWNNTKSQGCSAGRNHEDTEW